jgi:hypothetical protein
LVSAPSVNRCDVEHPISGGPLRHVPAALVDVEGGTRVLVRDVGAIEQQRRVGGGNEHLPLRGRLPAGTAIFVTHKP